MRPVNLKIDAAQGIPGVGEGYDHIVDMDYWHDDGSYKFNILWERTKEEVVVEWKKRQSEG